MKPPIEYRPKPARDPHEVIPVTKRELKQIAIAPQADAEAMIERIRAQNRARAKAFRDRKKAAKA